MREKLISFIKSNYPTLILFFLGLGIYSVNLKGPLFWDDEIFIVNNEYVHRISFENIKLYFTKDSTLGVDNSDSDYYRPIMMLSFAANYLIHGISPLGYHLVNNLLHITAAVLLYNLLTALFKNKTLSFLTALIFLIHPLQTEAVSYVSGRGEPLAAVFMLLALNYSVRRSGFFVPMIYFIFALLSKESAIIFPALLILTKITHYFDEKSFKDLLVKALRATAPYFVLSLFYVVSRLTILNFGSTLTLRRGIIGVYDQNVWVRVVTFLRTVWEYVKLVIVPKDLHVRFTGPIHESLLDWPVWIILVIILGVLYFIYHMHQTKGDKSKVWFFGFFWFFINLASTSGILVPMNAIMQEHWLYLAMSGPVIIIALGAFGLWRFLRLKNVIYRMIFVLVGAVYVAFLMVVNIKASLLWTKPLSMYENVLKYEPKAARIANNVGVMYTKSGNEAESQRYFQQAVSAGALFPEAYSNLGSILLNQGRESEAFGYYKKAVEVKPDYLEGWRLMEIAYGERDMLDEAIWASQKVNELTQTDPKSYYNLAFLYWRKGESARAVDILKNGLPHVGEDQKTKEIFSVFLQVLEKE